MELTPIAACRKITDRIGQSRHTVEAVSRRTRDSRCGVQHLWGLRLIHHTRVPHQCAGHRNSPFAHPGHPSPYHVAH